LANPNPPDSRSTRDVFTFVGSTTDDAWTFTARLIASPTGLKVWSLTIAPTGVRADGEPPQDAPGAGINTGILKMINFPQLREIMKRQTDAHLARVLEELDNAPPEDRGLLEQVLARARREATRSTLPKTNRPGRPAADDGQRAQWALDVLERKDRHGYRQELRQLWIQREGGQLNERTVDTRMRRLRDDGWLIGYGKLASTGSKLKVWLESSNAPQDPTARE
jgi:hypothetical protein